MRRPLPGRSLLTDVLLLAAVIALFAVPMALRLGVPEGPDVEAYTGSDTAATELVAGTGYEPWFSPLFAPSSGEVESGLFALQAAIGGGLLGFTLGRLSARRPGRGRGEQATS